MFLLINKNFVALSFFLDELPSPTPSEGSDNGDGDIVAPALAQSIVSFPSHVDITSGQGMINVRNAGTVSSGPNIAFKSSAKGRDPRLWFANPDLGALDLNQRVLPMFNTESKVDGFGETAISRK
ncbi:protein-serine,threonine phosphatase [Sarracenia purpurea var. burkii]